MLPNDWKYGQLSDGISLISGQHIAVRHYNSEHIGIPYLTGPYDFNGKTPVATKFTNKPKSCCKAGDILITVKGSGTGTIAFADRDYCISRQLMAVRPTKFDSNFTYFLLQYNSHRYNISVTGLIPGINRENILSTPVAIPPIKEQQSIGILLAAWDLAIEKTEKLIYLKLQAKQWVMQQFLTGKKRLKNFQGSWQEHHLGDLFKERNETGYQHLPLLSITREEGVIPRVEVNRKDTSSEDKFRYLRICPGDIGYNTMRMWQGVSALSTLEGIVSPAYTICTPLDGVDGEFMAYLFKLPKTIHLFYRYSQGLTSDTWNLKFHHFREIKVTIPDIEEQKAIAEVLKTCDVEIMLLKKKLEALKKQKRGLMQKLLTGQWRLKTA